VEEYAECLDANPPVYLMLSKTDQLPGFSQAFDGLDLHERQQPLGMTFGLSEIRTSGLHAVLQTRLKNLQGHVRQHVDAQMIALGAEADSTLLNFPQYFAALSGVLEQFLDHFTRGHRGGAPLLLRGLYFTSALQNGQQLGQVYEDVIADEFALQAAYDEQAGHVGKALGNRSYFITDTFRQVIFPDRDLILTSRAWAARLRSARCYWAWPPPPGCCSSAGKRCRSPITASGWTACAGSWRTSSRQQTASSSWPQARA
jgi:type VI secretion system protein ImpL